MKLSEMAVLFEKHADEHIKFERIENPPSKSPDLCAFLLLDRLAPSDRDIVSAANHDEIWLSTDIAKLAEVASEDDIVYLVRCGVRYDDEFECLGMFT